MNLLNPWVLSIQTEVSGEKNRHSLSFISSLKVIAGILFVLHGDLIKFNISNFLAVGNRVANFFSIRTPVLLNDRMAKQKIFFFFCQAYAMMQNLRLLMCVLFVLILKAQEW